jgi:spermidine/putrescine-binding protein
MKSSQVLSWESSVFAAMRRLAAGRGLTSSVGWTTAPLLSEPGERALSTSLPLPGSASFCDCVALVARAPQREKALRVIDELQGDEVQAILANETRWATVNPHALPSIRPEVANLVPYETLDAHLDAAPIRGYPPFSRDDEDVATYLDWVIAWDRIRATPIPR